MLPALMPDVREAVFVDRRDTRPCSFDNWPGVSHLPEGDLRIARQFTAGFRFAIALVPKGRLNPPNVLLQPSLRDAITLSRSPTLERVGYCQISLREMADEYPVSLREDSSPEFAAHVGQPTVAALETIVPVGFSSCLYSQVPCGSAENPKGIPQHSPGLARSAYPGKGDGRSLQPQRGCGPRTGGEAATPLGLGRLGAADPG